MQERRRIKVINRPFQHNFMLKTVLCVLITLNIIILTVYLIDRHYGWPGNILNVFSASLILLELLAVGIVGWIGREVSLQIAGPVYAIERTLKKMTKGDISQRLHLRQGDNFGQTADTLNTVLEIYQNRIAELQQLAADNSEDAQKRLRQELAWFTTEAPARDAVPQALNDPAVAFPEELVKQTA